MAPDSPQTAARDERSDSTHRSIELARDGDLHFVATNRRGGTLAIGSGEDDDFTPVELLLAALAACGAIDLESVTGKRAPFSAFAARGEGHKIRDEQGSRMVDLAVTFDVAFPEGEDGDRARAVLQRTVRQVQDRLCTVGRTVSVGDPVDYRTGDLGPQAG
ncbi:OsmC family peroxiredoxin [Nocardioides sp. dk4132]|uniref:OsmC family protein n=1 Tax=unclassified Nocardioides TaxID=2615069 RepID=UPI001297BB59|nr:MULTISPECIES: OsmC family protein [unclassified Nocardioides]MQW75209.1 OsmC family peroxiredoxin [Nocardioides sp. dk4132]QGA07638.1 OsmC family peroxiredoxin [Nocardioides sp. dk884]